MAEAIAYFRAHHTGVVPHGILRGIQDALRGFDEYQLAKYFVVRFADAKRDGKAPGVVSMRDVLRLARPKPKDDAERALWSRVVSRSLETPYTWEVELSQCVTDEEKRAKWNELIRSGKLGLFALVRNLRNIVQSGAAVEEALSQITAERVKGSGILLFQWYKAYKAIAEAAGEGLADVPKLAGVTLVACDNSSSMSHTRSGQTRGMSNAESVNLATQDNSCQFAPEQPVVELAGWSESIFQFISAMEVGQSVIEHITTHY